MSSFTEPLAVWTVDGLVWRTLRDFRFWTDCDDTDLTIAPHIRCLTAYFVPEGTLTDFATIPRWLWPIVGPPTGRYAQAAVLHDRLYATGIVSRTRADEIFREAMMVLNVPAWQRGLMYAAVRVGGAGAFEQHAAARNST